MIQLTSTPSSPSNPIDRPGTGHRRGGDLRDASACRHASSFARLAACLVAAPLLLVPGQLQAAEAPRDRPAAAPAAPAAPSAAPTAAATATPLDAPALVALAARRNPALLRMRALWRAASSQVDVVGRWPEPTIGAAVAARPVETRVGPQRGALSVSVPVPWLDRPKRLAEAQRRRADVAERRVALQLAALQAKIRVPWARRAWLRIVAGRYDAQRKLLVQLEPSLLARLRVGKASFADAQRLRLLIEALADNAASARDEIVAIDTQLRAEADLPGSAALAPASFERDPFGRGAPPTLRQLRPLLAELPSVRVADAAIRAAAAGVAAAATQGKPAFAFGLDWVVVGAARMANVADSGNDALLVKAAVKLPVWRGGYDAEVDVARARQRGAVAGRRAALRRAEVVAARLLFVLRDARRKRALFKQDLVPRAEAALTTVTTAYTNGRATFQSLIELQRQLLQFQIGLAAAELKRVTAQASLEALLGRPLRAAGQGAPLPAGATLAPTAPAAGQELK